jgi:hypothetical protein
MLTRLLFAATLLAMPAAMPQDDVEIPAAAKPFVAPGTRPIAYEVADLNRDGREDAILVLERRKTKPEDEDIVDGQRPLLILVGQSDGSLRQAARNDKIVPPPLRRSRRETPFPGSASGLWLTAR